jgi:potassium uptake TrkH family protein
MSKLTLNIKDGSGKSQAHEKRELLRDSLIRYSRIFIALLAVTALISMIADFGFYLKEDIREYTSLLPGAVLYGFSFYYILRVALEKDRVAFVKSHRIELLLIGFIIIYLLFPQLVSGIVFSINPMLNPKTLTYVYLIITQALAIITLLLEAINQSKKLINRRIQPAMLLMMSFITLITIGALLLMMPKSTFGGHISFVDALFTSASAVTVTGLTVVDTEGFFTYNGKLIILGLIQTGGLGIMTLTTFFAFSSGKSYNLKEYVAVQEMFGEENISGLKRLVYQIVGLTFLIEFIGALLIFYSADLSFISSTKGKVFFSVFHSVSAFCNAGFSLLSQNLAHKDLFVNFPFLLIIMCLIIAGGLGFPVLRDIRKVFVNNVLNRNNIQFKLHSRLVLITSAALILTGAIFYFVLENNSSMNDQNTFQQLLTSVFQSVTTRTAGFNTVDFTKISLPVIFIIIVLMWIGGSPASTGGGIKTTAFSISLLNLFAIAKGKDRVEIFKKRISSSDISRSFSTIILSMIYISIATFLLLLSENTSFEKILFEVISASSTVGLSLGITPELTSFGKLIVTATMFIGRIGFLTFTLALFKRMNVHLYDYVEEKIII